MSAPRATGSDQRLGNVGQWLSRSRRAVPADPERNGRTPRTPTRCRGCGTMSPRGRNADKHALEPRSPCSVDGEPTVAVRSRPAAPHLVLRDVLRMGPTVGAGQRRIRSTRLCNHGGKSSKLAVRATAAAPARVMPSSATTPESNSQVWSFLSVRTNSSTELCGAPPLATCSPFLIFVARCRVWLYSGSSAR
jgi:hypothetical protein